MSVLLNFVTLNIIVIFSVFLGLLSMTVAAITGEITCVCLVVLLLVGGWLLFLSMEKSAAVL